MFVSLAFLAGCRQREVLPEPSQAALVGKIKAWFENKTKPQNNKTTSTDTTTWYPQWHEGIIQNIDAHTRLALFPVHRKRAVQYYEIGFVRRLAIRIDAQGEVIDGQIIEMLSSKTYLQQHKNTIPLRYYQGYISDSDYALVFKSIDNERIKRDKNIPEMPCIVSVTLNFLECTLNVTYSEACDMASYTMPITGGCGGGSSGTGGGIGSSPPSGGWGTPVDVGGGGSPYIPVYTDYPVGGGGGSTPPCPTCLSEDLGDNTNPIPNPPQLPPDYLHDAFKSFLFPNSYSTPDGWEKMNREFTKVYDNSCLMQLLIQDLKATGKPVQIVAYTNIPNVANMGVVLGKTKLGKGMNQTGQIVPIINITLSNVLFTNATWKTSIANTLFEELIHGVQTINYENAPVPVSNSNIEFEAKVLQDIVYILSGEKTFQVFPMAFDGKENQEYKNWLREITKDGKEMPDFSEASAQNKYTARLDAFIEYWSAKGHPTYGKPKSYHQPTVLYELLKKAKNQNCNK